MTTLKYQIALLTTVIFFSCNSRQNDIGLTDKQPTDTITQKQTTEPTVEAIVIDLKTIMNEFDFGKDEFKANKKYVGQVLKVKGRTSGVDEDGSLTMQVKSGDEALWCYGLPDDFLLSINKNDIVEITGTFGRKEMGMGITMSKLENCFEYKKIEK